MHVSKHDRRLAEIKDWFASLPEGAAQLDVNESPDWDQGSTHVDIRPVRNPSAAEIKVRITGDTGFVSFGSGGAYRAEDTDWEGDGIPLQEVCQAIASGGLTVETRFWNGRETGTTASLKHSGESRPECIHDVRWPPGEIGRLILGPILGGRSKQVIRYPPYG
jgi:hypothetical protein